MIHHSVKRRIALLVGRFIPALGGLESWSHDLAVALAARGHRVKIITTEAEIHPPSVSITIVPASPRLWQQARLFDAAARTFQDHIIHDTGAGLAADIFQPQTGCRVLNLAREAAAQPPATRLRHAVSPSYQRWRWAMARLERAQLKAAGCVIAVSQESAATFQSRYNIPAARIRLLPNGIDTQRFHPGWMADLRDAARTQLGLPPQTLVLLTAAGNFRLKGVQHSIAALAALRTQCPEAVLLVAGQGDIPTFAALAARQGAAAQVRFLGQIADMVPLFAAADLFVHPTAHDACSLATLEAMASGLPVITTSRNGAADGMTDGREGFVLAAPDAAMLADQILRLRDPVLRAKLGQAARRLAENHDFTQTVDQLEALYAAQPPHSLLT